MNRADHPREPVLVLQRHRTLLLENKAVEAHQIYNEARAQGVRLPDLSG